VNGYEIFQRKSLTKLYIEVQCIGVQGIYFGEMK